MITLTIIAVMSACAAPLISKQMKNNEFSDIQVKRLNEKIDVLNKEVSKIDQNVLWGLSSDKKSVYRNGGNVGIGTNSPIAKLQVNVPANNPEDYIMSALG